MTGPVVERALEDDLREHYQRIRALYVTEYRKYLQRTQGYDPSDYGKLPMPAWDGGTDRSGRQHQPIWPKLAQLAYTNRVCPFDMIRAVFFRWSHQIPPTPRHIVSRHGLEAVRTFRIDKARAIESTVRSAKSILAAEISAALRTALSRFSQEQIITSVLLDRSSAPILVKYCAAVAFGAAKLAWQMRHQAALEYLSYPDEWRRALGDHLPEDLVEYALEYVLPGLSRD